MAERLNADARPEKRLFISLLTRDISLVAAFLDLVDNSVNAAVEPVSDRLKTANGYQQVFDDATVQPSVNVYLKLAEASVEVRDNAGGISAATAEQHVFKFGRSAEDADTRDRLSVYGIGLKRAIFKLGRQITIRSDHVEGGFDLKLNVDRWAADTTQPWTFPITRRDPVPPEKCGTTIIVSDLNEEVSRRICDGLFVGQLREAISRTYAFYIAKFVTIYLGDQPVEPMIVDIGANRTSETLEIDGVSCAIAAGIGDPQGGAFRDRSSGWFIFCNGRTVISADKSPLTGWANPGTGLPIFQPKHRPFVGHVFFVSDDPEKLPWTTTKAGINEDSAIWQEAKRHMVVVGRSVISFLDGRYTDEGTEIASADLRQVAQERISVLSSAVSARRSFTPPPVAQSETMRIQYDAKVSDIRKIAQYLRRPGMGGAEVGRHTFLYFLRNEVGEK
ncbi:MAG: ATP-binding protein [Rhodopila sp.]|nr:ATP-binding protein [Rhodopila sp.]